MKQFNAKLNRIEFPVPFNRDFNNKIKKAGGRFDGNIKRWWIDANAEEIADKILLDVYGYSANAQAVTIEVTMDFKDFDFEYANGGSANFLGRTVVGSFSRDRKFLGEGVRILKGDYRKSGGSAKYPCVEFDEESVFVFQMEGIFKAKIDKFLEDHPKWKDVVTIKDASKEAALHRLEERRKILVRDLEILDAQIKNLK